MSVAMALTSSAITLHNENSPDNGWLYIPPKKLGGEVGHRHFVRKEGIYGGDIMLHP